MFTCMQFPKRKKLIQLGTATKNLFCPQYRSRIKKLGDPVFYVNSLKLNLIRKPKQQQNAHTTRLLKRKRLIYKQKIYKLQISLKKFYVRKSRGQAHFVLE